MTKQEQETLSCAVWNYGPPAQELKTVEELSELSQALCKAITASNTGSMSDFLDAIDHVFEEIADVEIMLAQIRLIFSDADERIEEWKIRKLARLRQRMGAPRG